MNRQTSLFLTLFLINLALAQYGSDGTENLYIGKDVSKN